MVMLTFYRARCCCASFLKKRVRINSAGISVKSTATNSPSPVTLM
jgi:hypothetical protein